MMLLVPADKLDDPAEPINTSSMRPTSPAGRDGGALVDHDASCRPGDADAAGRRVPAGGEAVYREIRRSVDGPPARVGDLIELSRVSQQRSPSLARAGSCAGPRSEGCATCKRNRAWSGFARKYR
jgi:hypothetical protein